MTFPSFAFATATEIRFGRGEAARAVPAIAALGRDALLVTGANAARGDWLVADLSALGVHVTRFRAPVEPDVDLVQAGVQAARAAGAKVVIAVGGGAAIDTAKAIAALVSATRPMHDHLEVVGRGLPLDHPPLPFVALPTTAGTGAEVTRNAVIAVPDHRRKVSLRDAKMLPLMAIVDPGLTDGCPKGVTLASGLDAVTQVIEPFICTRANPFTDALCRDAIPTGLRALNTLMQDEDPGARDALAWTSLCGGLALANSGLGVVHGLAGPLGGLSGAAHGAICGVLLPHGLSTNARHVQSPDIAARITQVAQWISEVFGGPVKGAFETLAHWSADAGLAGLDALGITEDDRQRAAQAAATSSSMKANPAALTAEDLAALMAAAR